MSSYAVTDEMRMEEEGSVIDDDTSIDSSEFDDDIDMKILDKSSLVMQYVVNREQQLARLGIRNQAKQVHKNS